MEAGKQITIAWQREFSTVGELEARLALGLVRALQVLQITVEGYATETDDYPQFGQQRDFLVQVRRTILQLGTLGRVVGRGTTDHRADPAILELHAVVARQGIGLRGKTGFVENGI